MIRRTARLAFVLAAAALSAAPVAAQRFGGSIGFERHGRHGEVRVGFGFGGHDYGRRHEHRVWVPGRYETVAQQVWVPGRVRQVWCEPVYETVYDACGRPIRRCVANGYWKTVEDPGCYETRYVQVWREGYWTARC
jgi:hypothetical protein